MFINNLVIRGLIVAVCGLGLALLGQGQVFKMAPSLSVDLFGWIAFALGIIYITVGLIKRQ